MQVSVLIQAGTALVAILALAIALTQLRIMRATTDGASLQQALELLNSLELRSARRIVYGLGQKPFSDWSPEEIAAVEVVGGQFSHLGFMIKHGYVPRAAFMSAWEYRFTRTFAIVAPYLSAERTRLKLDQHWIYFEWLARSACAHRDSRSPWWEESNDDEWRNLKARTSHM